MSGHIRGDSGAPASRPLPQGLSQGPAPGFLSLVFFFLKTLCLHPMALRARLLWPQWAVPAPGEGVFQEGLPAQGCTATSLGQQTRQAQKGGRQALPEADERVSGRGAWLWSLLHLSLALSPGAHFPAVAAVTISALWVIVVALP